VCVVLNLDDRSATLTFADAKPGADQKESAATSGEGNHRGGSGGSGGDGSSGSSGSSGSVQRAGAATAAPAGGAAPLKVEGSSRSSDGEAAASTGNASSTNANGGGGLAVLSWTGLSAAATTVGHGASAVGAAGAKAGGAAAAATAATLAWAEQRRFDAAFGSAVMRIR
jgi:hypothetical protein